ncbi:hypothetical protein DJ84_14570 [Halorubrum ezzemoulense]|nr:hypothetical protein DJ84_14570 [Halorubrum ezzemoulense]
MYQTARTRKSTNASTIVDNRNILDGVENNAYTDAKIAAIEELNAGSAESAVLDAATKSANSYFSTIEANLLKSWNESLNELASLLTTVRNHSGLSVNDVITDRSDGVEVTVEKDNLSLTLADGSSFSLHQLRVRDTSSESADYEAEGLWDPTQRTETHNGGMHSGGYPGDLHVKNPDGDTLIYLAYGTWNSVWSEMQTILSNVQNGLSTWVTNVYGDVQSGDIEITELITPRDRAAMLSDDESEAQAIADLAALNIPIDSEREVTITISETGATLSGTIGLTDESDGPIESGATYDPSTFAGDVYLTADVSQLSGTWDAYETGVDGGTITLTAQPYDGTVLNVTTTASETVSVPAADWTDNGDGTYSYDASSELETAITEVDSVEYVSGADQTQYETLNLSKQFTVESIVNQQTGEQTSSASFESSEPQSDSNYITQEEWDQLEQQNQELIEKYEESQSSGGAGAGWFEGSSPDVGLIAAVVGGAGVVYALFGQGGNS